MMTKHDEALVRKARSQRWEEIDEEAAETPEGRQALHDIIARKYHTEEFKNGTL